MDQQQEFKKLLFDIRDHYDYDLSVFAQASLKRRIDFVINKCAMNGYADLLSRIRGQEFSLDDFLAMLTVNVSEMFRDPATFATLRKKVIPRLKMLPYIKVWVAGCANGEELYSVAILLSEAGITKKATIFATDISSQCIKKAKNGIYRVASIKQFTKNYHLSGGSSPFSDYYTANYGIARIDPALKSNVVFAKHDLCTDGVFARVHLILCRNVLIYFDSHSQKQVLDNFNTSLYKGGFLCLGDKESLRISSIKSHFSEKHRKQKIYQKLLLKTAESVA